MKVEVNERIQAMGTGILQFRVRDLTYSPSYVTNSAVSGKSQDSCAAHLRQARGIPRSLHQPPGPHLCPKKHTVRLFGSSVR